MLKNDGRRRGLRIARGGRRARPPRRPENFSRPGPRSSTYEYTALARTIASVKCWGRARSHGFFRWYGTDHHGRNNASPRCHGRVCIESDCWPDTYWRQPLPHVTPPGSLARLARHLLARGLGRDEVRFRRSENAPPPRNPLSQLTAGLGCTGRDRQVLGAGLNCSESEGCA
jgi:hypothetical protein